MLGRYLLGIPAMRDATPEQLVVAIGPVIQHYLTGPVSGKASTRQNRQPSEPRKVPQNRPPKGRGTGRQTQNQ
jgi:hypothetical protein